MNIETKNVDDVVIVEILETRIDAKSALSFKAKINELILQGHELILLDLAKVEFIDSSGLGAIVSCLKTINRQGELALCCISNKVLTMFQITRMDRVFQIFSTKEEAVTALSRQEVG